MFESEVGVEVAATRQNAGRLAKTWPFGAVYFPAATGSAAVILVSGNLKRARLAHVSAAAGAAPMLNVRKNRPAARLRHSTGAKLRRFS